MNPHCCWSPGVTPATEINGQKTFNSPATLPKRLPVSIETSVARLVWRAGLHSLWWLMENPFELPSHPEGEYIYTTPCDLVLAGLERKICPCQSRTPHQHQSTDDPLFLGVLLQKDNLWFYHRARVQSQVTDGRSLVQRSSLSKILFGCLYAQVNGVSFDESWCVSKESSTRNHVFSMSCCRPKKI